MSCAPASRLADPRVLHGVQAEELVLDALREPVEPRPERTGLPEPGVQLLGDRVACDAEQRAAEGPGRVARAEEAVGEVPDPADPEQIALVARLRCRPVGRRAAHLRLAGRRDRLPAAR